MTELNLRTYLAELDSLLERGTAADEVVHHCRHILQHFPKNVATYRLLGQALLQQSRWEEAAEMLQRVLGVFPLDFSAQQGLAQAYSRAGQHDLAIWHLERAFDQQPNNPEITDTLREWYLQFRKVEVNRFQLTAGAVAQQHLRSGLYDRALETLQAALEKTPDRADLRVLMITTMWNAGQQVDAAEAALALLNDLPYCFEANRILTVLWLNEKRPSDAQRFLNRIEAVDPYAARELATGTGG